MIQKALRSITPALLTTCLILTVGGAAQAQPGSELTTTTLGTSAVRSGAVGPETHVYCEMTASISPNYTANTYVVRGQVFCDFPGYIRLRCKPVHKHTLGWHSHAWAFDRTKYFSSSAPHMDESSSSISGTNGDRYKTHCEAWHTAYDIVYYVGTDESTSIIL